VWVHPKADYPDKPTPINDPSDAGMIAHECCVSQFPHAASYKAVYMMQVMQFNMLILGNWLEFGFDETERTAVENTSKKCVFCSAASSVFTKQNFDQTV
jgi:hypothetical protein